MEKLLKVNNLKTYFHINKETVKAVDDISFELNKGEILGIVGESGCGKSITALSLLKLVDEPGKIVGGEILFEGKDLLKLPKDDLRLIRGNEIAMIFQEPGSALNPLYTIGSQIMESLILHKTLSKKEAYDKSIELIEKVGISRPKDIMNHYPHELSGGMLQRVMIAIALSCDPKLIIADEPTTALDVTIQAQILDILRNIRKEYGTSIILITHDLGVVAEMADRVIVMYAGKIIEKGEVREIFKATKHPYTNMLLKAKPVVGKRRDRLISIEGSVPDLRSLKPSCYFNNRCQSCIEQCNSIIPKLKDISSTHKVACHLYESEA